MVQDFFDLELQRDTQLDRSTPQALL